MQEISSTTMLFRFIRMTQFSLLTPRQQSLRTAQPPLQQLLLALLPPPIRLLLREREIQVFHLSPNIKSCLSRNPIYHCVSTDPNLPPGIPKSFTPHPLPPLPTHVAKNRPQISTFSSALHGPQQKPLLTATCPLNTL